MEHHVYFWLKEENQNPVDRAVFEQGLARLFEINLVAGGRWAVPAKVMLRPVIDQSWDYALTMQFATIEEHDALFAAQGFACGACGADSPNSKKGWSTDHCHETGKVRGILCHHCNVGLGHAKDDISALRAWISYLERSKSP